MFTCITLLTVNVWTEINNSNRNNSLKNSVPSMETSNLFTNYIDKHDLKINEKVRNIEDNEVSNTNSLPIRGNYQLNIIRDKPWFMANGTKRPTSIMSKLSLWPEESSDDRIVNQLMYLPIDYNQTKVNKLKKILLYFGRGGWNDLAMGQTKFLADNCPVNTCSLTANQAEAQFVDAIFFKDRFHWPKHRRWINQVWILFLLECPLHTQLFRNLGDGVFNWTATYRHDSDIVAPYEKFVTYNSDSQHSTIYNKKVLQSFNDLRFRIFKMDEK
jgi:glycoprotein 3-alpha-L-fucosyltransferase